MLPRNHQNHHHMFLLKSIRLLALLLATMIVWHLSSLKVMAGPQLPSAQEEQIEMAATTTGDHSEPTLAFSQAVTTTLSGQIGQETPAAICPVAQEIPLESTQSSVVDSLLSLSRAVLLGSSLKERVNILLLGSDSRPGEKYGHTDTMMLVTIEPVAKTAGMFSIPRDLWVSIPGYGEGRINQAYRLGQLKGHPGGGTALVKETIQANLGIVIDFYILISFDGFVRVVDLLGGIDLCVPETIDSATYYGYQAQSINKEQYYSFVPLNAIPASLNNQAATIQDTLADPNSGYEFLYIEAGPHTLDGETALAYAQSRASVTADFARVQRQQAILMAIKNKALQLNIIPLIPELWAAREGLVETDMELTDIVQLAHLAQTIPSANIRTGAISHQETVDYKTSSGARVLLPKRAAIKTLLEGMFGPVNLTAPLTKAEIEAGVNTDQAGQIVAWHQ